MYFPTSTARQLSTVPPLPNLPSEPVLQLCSSPRKSLFCTITRSGIALWRVRPSAVIAYLARTPASIIDHGENKKAFWSPDGSRIVIQTNESYLVVVAVEVRASEPVYQRLQSLAQANFLPGPGESTPLTYGGLHFEGVLKVDGLLASISLRRHCIYFSTVSPPVVQKMPWPDDSEEQEGGSEVETQHTSWLLDGPEFQWLIEPEVFVTQFFHSRTTGMDVWITSDGRVYFVYLVEDPESGPHDEQDQSRLGDTTHEAPTSSSADETQSSAGPTHSAAAHSRLVWQGTCLHDFKTPRWVEKQRKVDPDEPLHEKNRRAYIEPKQAVTVAINGRFSLLAIGTIGGEVILTSFPTSDGELPAQEIAQVPNPYSRPFGRVHAMEWSSDGYVLAVGWEHGWAIFSVAGRCLASSFSVDDLTDREKFHDVFMSGVADMFWAPGNFELFLLADPSLTRPGTDKQLFVLPLAKSATTGQHSPDNTQYAFLQMEDRVLIYRGADQPDMSIINPESDVWQRIRIPQRYLASHAPIRYSALSGDGRLIAVAGRHGLIHYSAASGRWKMFEDEVQENAFAVKGGLLWFHHVLVAAVEVSKTYQIRLYSRDLDLSNQNVLHREMISVPIIILSLVDNSLLVYAADNTLIHYLIVPTPDTIKLHLCGTITFNGIIASPSAVRMLSWMIPTAHKQLGDPVDDLAVATVLMVVGGQLVLLRPRKSGDHEVKYDMQIFADRIEFCWTHLRGIGALENSLWGYDGQGIRVWLNALAIEIPTTGDEVQKPKNIKESVNIPLDFYPLSVLMDKGIIIGAEYEAATRSNLPFVVFRYATSSHLFLHHILLVYLEARHVKEAVAFALHYQNLVYFGHCLEILLHTVVESQIDEAEEANGSEETNSDGTLQSVVAFLDYFDQALDVVVGCARKTEVTRWRRLFDVVGNPKMLFETCLLSRRLKTAGSYLLVLHNLEQLDEHNEDAVRLLKIAKEAKDWQLCRDLLRFLRSIDESGTALRDALTQASITEVSVTDL